VPSLPFVVAIEVPAAEVVEELLLGELAGVVELLLLPHPATTSAAAMAAAVGYKRRFAFLELAMILLLRSRFHWTERVQPVMD
jgi:hypothetical protein